MKNPLAHDLDFIVLHTKAIWSELKDARLFITGGTGFMGSWLLESLLWANKILQLNLSLVVLTRKAAAFARRVPHLAADPALTFLEGNVRDFTFPVDTFSHVIHAATEACAQFNRDHPEMMFNTILQGTQRTLDFAIHVQAKKFLFLSSGAVYGRQPAEILQLDENYRGAPDLLKVHSAYGVGKYTAEHLCVLKAQCHAIEIKIARCFAFVGPYLPLDKHFAIGNFIQDGLSHRAIQVNSDGSAYRSYQYAADLVIWLLHILCRGESLVPYNVGSDHMISIAALAELVAHQFPGPLKIQLEKLPQHHGVVERYVPSIQRAQETLGLKNHISLSEAIQKTIDWHQCRRSLV